MRKTDRKHPKSPGPPIGPSVGEMLEDIQNRIAAIPELKSYLRELKASGVSAERVLEYVATLVLLDTFEGWPRDPRARGNAQEWRSLAKRLQSVAEDVKDIYSTDSRRPDVLALSLRVAWVEPVPTLHDPQNAIESMLRLAADLKEKARLSGRIRKTVIPWIKRRPEVALLRHVCKPIPCSPPELSRERLRDLFQRLAEMLHTIYEAFGIKCRFSADSLEKTFERYVLPGLVGS